MTTDSFIVAIPARLGASRLPGKPLRLLAGVPMIIHVVQRALESGAKEVVVATDDSRIETALAGSGARVCLTDPQLPSGTDRLAACADMLGWPNEQVVVNLQGDEPLAPAAGIRAVASRLVAAGTEMATLAEPVAEANTVFDPHAVKVVCAANGHALYFSRAPVPWDRDGFAQNRLSLRQTGGWLRHIGIYAYRAGFLRRFRQLSIGQLERLESLEQLRVLEAGIAIAVGLTPAPFPGGVDTEADLQRVEKILNSRPAAPACAPS